MIAPLAPSVIVIVPEFVPPFVSKVKSYAPLEVKVAVAAPVPILVSPVPFGIIATSILESPPVADMLGALPVAAFEYQIGLLQMMLFEILFVRFRFHR